MIPQLMHLRCEALSWGVESDPSCVPAQTHHIERVINFTLPQEVLVAKLAGRRVCDTCGRNYNVAAIDNGARQKSSRLCTCVTLTSLVHHCRVPPPPLRSQATSKCRRCCPSQTTVTFARATHRYPRGPTTQKTLC